MERAAKKLFGTHVTPQDSPVQPEKFSGYHTGTDFETFPEEAQTDVAISAVCDGTVRAAERVGGYGGVLVEQCVLHGSPVTVLYGHLRLASVTLKAGASVKAGARIGVLGTGYSAETDGERKHLHLSIHKGAGIDWKGYVPAQAALSAWIDPLSVLR